MTLSEEITRAKADLESIKDFVEYLDRNLEEHSKNVQKGVDLPADDLENSIAFLRDYALVAKSLVAVINEYDSTR